MARTNKTGIDYFPFDVDFFNDEKIEFVSARFGIKGENIAIRLLCKIYRNGYYTEWNEDESMLLSKRAGEGISPSLASDIVNELVKRGFFDKDIFNRFSVLTSRGIQKRYFEATKRYQSVYVERDFLLINIENFINVHIKENNVNINNDNVNINNDNVNINDTKEKEREKENKIKGEVKKEPDEPVSPPVQKDKIDFDLLVKTYHECCPKMPKVKALTKQRKISVEARNKEHGKKVIHEVIKKAGASKFLNGENDRGFTANFDWIFNPSNFVKILEGNYDNKEFKKEKSVYKPPKNELKEDNLGQSPDYNRYIQNIQELAEKKKIENVVSQ